MTASSEVYTATTILYSTQFQQSVYNTVQAMTPFTVSAEQSLLSPYSLLIIALVALVAVIAYAYVKTRRK
jgi:subtilase family serine protease